MERDIVDLQRAFEDMRERQSSQATSLAVIATTLQTVSENIIEMKGGLFKLVWAFGISFITAISTFIINGGLVNFG